MIYEIINPSDAYTIAADDHAVAAVACFILGEGHYAFEPVDGSQEKRVPIFIFGGADEWCQETFGMNASDLVQKTLKSQLAALIDCLESCLIGKLGAREEFEEACSLIDDEAKREAFKKSRHDRRRSSMNDIGGRAYRIAAKLRTDQNGDVAPT